MRLIDDAEKVFKRAWSVRLNLVGIVLGAGATVLPLATAAVPAELLLPFCGITFVVVCGAALTARFVKQDGMSQDNPSGEP
jgi:hypothetical protein